MNSRKVAFGGALLTCLIVMCFTAFGALPYSDGNLANADDSNNKCAVKTVDNLNQMNTKLTSGITMGAGSFTGSGTFGIDPAANTVQFAAGNTFNVGNWPSTFTPFQTNAANLCATVTQASGTTNTVTAYNTSASSATTTCLGTSGAIYAGGTTGMGYRVQNLSTNQMAVLEGTGCSSTNFSYILPACTAASDGTSYPYGNAQWQGAVSGCLMPAGTTTNLSYSFTTYGK